MSKQAFKTTTMIYTSVGKQYVHANDLVSIGVQRFSLLSST